MGNTRISRQLQDELDVDICLLANTYFVHNSPPQDNFLYSETIYLDWRLYVFCSIL